jgi:hypothetical protein
MKTPFRLDDHRRRPQPLAPPPDGYFDQLPMRIMQRVQPHAAISGVPGWLAALSAPLRTALAATVVLVGFAGVFLLSQPGVSPTSGAASAATLATVPHAEMVEYLLTSDRRLTLTDLAELPATEHALPESYLRASPDELDVLLESQPPVDLYL